jgi:hypothetical protein
MFVLRRREFITLPGGSASFGGRGARGATHGARIGYPQGRRVFMTSLILARRMRAPLGQPLRAAEVPHGTTAIDPGDDGRRPGQ